MRFKLRLIPALAFVCFVAALSSSPRSAKAQSPQQVHAITGLPLPPDDDTAAPVSSPATKPAPVVVAPAPRPAKKVTPKPAPAAETPVTQPAPLPTPVPAAVEPPSPVVAPTPKAGSRKGRNPKPAAAAPAATAPAENSVHAIKLAPPPDEEPATPVPATPVPATTAPATAAPATPAPKPVQPKPQPKTSPSPKPVAVEPVPVVKPAVNPELTPAPITSAPVELPPAPRRVAPKPAATQPSALEATPPTNRLPVAPVGLPTVTPPSSNVPAPKNVIVKTSVVPDEPPPPAPLPTRPAKPVKPQPTLKVRGTTSPVTVEMPTTVTRPSGKTSLPVAEPAAAPAPPPPPPPPGTLGHIVFQGAEPFTEADLAPLTGLTLGTKPTNDSLQTASSRLIETGLFSNVRASYDTPNDVGIATFILDPLPASQLARVSFANIVWLTPAEIEDTLKLLPLYRGVIPMGGNVKMADSIQAALQSAISARGVQATLTHMLVPPSPQHPYTAMEFRVISPNVVLASASLFDIPPVLVNRTLKAQTDAVKVPYNEGIAGTTLSDILLAPARNAGYIGARLWHIERKRHIVNRSTTSVDFVARMDAGPVYTVHSLSWTPTPVLSEADFRRQAALHIGQVPTAVAADKTEEVISDAYYAQGYLEADISATQNLNPKTGAADYAYTAVAGPQYHLGSISVQGLSPEAKQEFDTIWTMKPEDVYNEGYLLNFLATHQNVASLKGYTFTYNRSTSPDTHKVDLTLIFRK